MKILQISSARTFSANEQHFIELCRGLQARGHEVFAVIRPRSEWREKLDFLPKQNIFHVSIRNSFGIFSAQRIAGFMREKGIEIIHAHLARDYFPTSLACRLSKTAKFVLTRHNPAPMKPFHRFSLTNLSKAIAVSNKIKTNLQTLFSPEKVVFVPNGIELKDVSVDERKKTGEAFRFEHNIPFDAPFVGIIGELTETNGQRDFVLAAQIISEKFPDARFAVIGKDALANQSFRRELKRIVKVFGPEKQFLWLDFAEDSPAFFNALDVFVSPADGENILSAMANQTAIVAAKNDFLQNEETGLIVPVKSPVQLAEAVNKLLADENLLNKLRQRAQAIVKEKFSLDKMIGEIERIYQSLQM